jgi:predicted Rossmann fold flavoprotein
MVEEEGCPTKVERGMRVFPVSDHSSDVTRALQRRMERLGVEIRLYTCVESLLWEDGVCTGVRLANGKELAADAVVVATGGCSYPSTGSTGDGYRFAKTAGISLVEPKPALVPLECAEDWCKELMGLSLRNVEVTILDGKKKVFQEFGEMLFTHFGVTGPLILSASSHYVKKYYGKDLPLYIDLKPALSMEQLDKRVLRDFEENINKQFKNAVNGLFQGKLVPVMIRLSGIDPDKKVNEISKEERQHFVYLIKHLPLTITGTRSFIEAIITQGGVKVKEINPSTMEAKNVKGLYFAGEVLDVDAVTGGFNLQVAWSTGYLAGMSIE